MSDWDKREWRLRALLVLKPLGDLAWPAGGSRHSTWWRVYCLALRGHLALWRLGVRL
jgi:hypothetical protein